MTHPFRTILTAQKSVRNISHQDSVISLGSCFAQHIGERLQDNKFSIVINPYGILYNPVSIANSLELLMSDVLFSESNLFQHQGLWHSFAHHGHFSHPDSSICLSKINQSLTEGRAQLKRSNYLLLTFGTAYVFEDQKTQKVVANCHKLPNTNFTKKRLSFSTVTETIRDIFTKIHQQFPDLQIITSVSPVRHLREGHVDNQKSKATLVLALAEMEEQFPFVHYFPAYELMSDDLRDYRFYKEDLIHPNDIAIDYIWDFFSATFFNDSTKKLLTNIEKIRSASQHRPFHPTTPAHQSFLKAQLNKISLLEKEFPFLDFSKEEKIFRDQSFKKDA